MTMRGKLLPVRTAALRCSSEKRAKSPAISPAVTLCFDIFSPLPGESDVISQVFRLSSKETKIAPNCMRIAVGLFSLSGNIGSPLRLIGIATLNPAAIRLPMESDEMRQAAAAHRSRHSRWEVRFLWWMLQLRATAARNRVSGGGSNKNRCRPSQRAEGQSGFGHLSH